MAISQEIFTEAGLLSPSRGRCPRKNRDKLRQRGSGRRGFKKENNSKTIKHTIS